VDARRIRDRICTRLENLVYTRVCGRIVKQNRDQLGEAVMRQGTTRILHQTQVPIENQVWLQAMEDYGERTREEPR
jgi:hypothetical protein